MPPGMWHSVYTPIGTMTSGGHFLTYDTLHLMHNAHMYDDSELPKHLQSASPKMCHDLSTNESQSVDRQVLNIFQGLCTDACWLSWCSWLNRLKAWVQHTMIQRWEPGMSWKRRCKVKKKEGINDLQQDHEQAESYVGWHTGWDVTGAFGWLGQARWWDWSILLRDFATIQPIFRKPNYVSYCLLYLIVYMLPSPVNTKAHSTLHSHCPPTNYDHRHNNINLSGTIPTATPFTFAFEDLKVCNRMRPGLLPDYVSGGGEHLAKLLLMKYCCL